MMKRPARLITMLALPIKDTAADRRILNAVNDGMARVGTTKRTVFLRLAILNCKERVAR